MSRPSSSQVAFGDPARSEDPSLVQALERVYEAGQMLVVRRIDLLVEEFTAQAGTLLSRAVIGSAVALVGWFVTLAGLIDLLAQAFPRPAVQLALGILHLAVGVGVVARARRGASLTADT